VAAAAADMAAAVAVAAAIAGKPVRY